ncbi:MAG: hypothetical protein ACJ75J_13545 [Cytophagaceae bacterium]
MKMLILGILLSVGISTVSMGAAGDEDRRMKALEKQRKKNDKKQKELIARTVKSHEIKIYRREKLRVPKKVQDHVMEYKRKSKTEDKKTYRKTRRTYHKLNEENTELIKSNKRNYSTKYSQKETNTRNTAEDSSEGTVVKKRHIKKKNRGNTTMNNPEDIVGRI